MQRIAIVDYGSGNLHSARKAFERASCDCGIEAEIRLSGEPDSVAKADRIVLPGVGAYADCRAGLERNQGMLEAIKEAAIERGRPFLGVCVGAQLMAERGLEKILAEGLGWIEGDCVRIEPSDSRLKIPQMGWNVIDALRPHPLLEGIPTGESGWHAYFVHSYHVAPKRESDLIATADYGGPISALIGKGNLAGAQFHPEKSQKLGLALIANFLRWKP